MTSTAPPMLTTVVPEPVAWHGPSLAAARYLIPIPPAVLAELDGALGELRRAPVPTLLLLPYEDADTPGHRRHLVRLWLRAGDRRHFRG